MFNKDVKMPNSWIAAVVGFCTFIVTLATILGNMVMRHEHRMTKNEEGLADMAGRMDRDRQESMLWRTRMEDKMDGQTRYLSEIRSAVCGHNNHGGDEN